VISKKPMTVDQVTLRKAANDLTNGMIDQLHDILKHPVQENLRGARERGQTARNVMEAAAVLRTIRDYAHTACRRLEQIGSLMQLGEGDRRGYIELCELEGPGCDCEVVCKYKPKCGHTEREKACTNPGQSNRHLSQNAPPQG
jgi:hypothetical protein